MGFGRGGATERVVGAGARRREQAAKTCTEAGKKDAETCTERERKKGRRSVPCISHSSGCTSSLFTRVAGRDQVSAGSAWGTSMLSMRESREAAAASASFSAWIL